MPPILGGPSAALHQPYAAAALCVSIISAAAACQVGFLYTSWTALQLQQCTRRRSGHKVCEAGRHDNSCQITRACCRHGRRPSWDLPSPERYAPRRGSAEKGRRRSRSGSMSGDPGFEEEAAEHHLVFRSAEKGRRRSRSGSMSGDPGLEEEAGASFKFHKGSAQDEHPPTANQGGDPPRATPLKAPISSPSSSSSSDSSVGNAQPPATTPAAAVTPPSPRKPPPPKLAPLGPVRTSPSSSPKAGGGLTSPTWAGPQGTPDASPGGSPNRSLNGEEEGEGRGGAAQAAAPGKNAVSPRSVAAASDARVPALSIATQQQQQRSTDAPHLAAAHSARPQEQEGNAAHTPVAVKRRRTVVEVAADVVDGVAANPYVINLSTALLALSFLLDLYPSIPNVSTQPSTTLRVREARVSSAAVELEDPTVYNTDAARKVAGDTETVVTVAMSLLIILKFFTWQLSVGTAESLLIIIKFITWQGLLATSPEGRVALSLFWRRFKLFLPIWGEPRNLTQEVYNRLIALTWIHLTAAVVLVVLAAASGFGLEWAPQFSSMEGVGVPLSVLIFLKAFTLSFVTGALFSHMDLALSLEVFGCMVCARKWHEMREARRTQKHGTHVPKVVLDWEYVMLCVKLKLLDLLFGVWVWAGIGWSFSPEREYSERWNVKTMLSWIVFVQFMTDIWSVFLGAVLCLLVSQYLLRRAKRKERGEASPNKYPYPKSTLKPNWMLFSLGEPDEEIGNGDIEIRSRRRRSSEYDTETEEGGGGSPRGGSDHGGGGQDPRHGPDDRRGSQGSDGGGGSAHNAIYSQSFTAGVDGSRRGSKRGPSASRHQHMLLLDEKFVMDPDAFRRYCDVICHELLLLLLDETFVMDPDAFRRRWNGLDECGSFRVRVGAVPPVGVIAAHLRHQRFAVIASGSVNGLTKVYACAGALTRPQQQQGRAALLPTQAPVVGATIKHELLLHRQKLMSDARRCCPASASARCQVYACAGALTRTQQPVPAAPPCAFYIELVCDEGSREVAVACSALVRRYEKDYATAAAAAQEYPTAFFFCVRACAPLRCDMNRIMPLLLLLNSAPPLLIFFRYFFFVRAHRSGATTRSWCRSSCATCGSATSCPTTAPCISSEQRCSSAQPPRAATATRRLGDIVPDDRAVTGACAIGAVLAKRSRAGLLLLQCSTTRANRHRKPRQHRPATAPCGSDHQARPSAQLRRGPTHCRQCWPRAPPAPPSTAAAASVLNYKRRAMTCGNK
ncbi:hypothetical protein JKP88DRAFT_247768 [Tribonema minus]|uniref:Uncharacterized protein n=1 Tax=Tribonema minus TaxID=303371 RepID=A0A835YPD1_9STRA|nr:hypothetical protein JKP88DRAFT_247768 [Tribonema minus]